MINNEYDYSYNPDAYYKSVDNLYSDKEAVHNAKNIYTLPVQFKYLRN